METSSSAADGSFSTIRAVCEELGVTLRALRFYEAQGLTVRGEVTGKPAGELFGVPPTGKSFRMMAIDIQTIKDGKIAKTFHMENWLSALGQLRAK
jgi:hypothetical protein